MKTCKTCVYWRLFEGEWRPWRPHSKFRGKCLLVESHNALLGHPESLAVAEDADSYWATLFTTPDFGCVQHKEKE